MLILLSLSSIFSFLPFTTSMAFSDIIDSWMSRSHILVPISNTSLFPQPNVLTSLPTLQAKPPIPFHSHLSPHNDLDVVSGSPFPIPFSLDICQNLCLSSSQETFSSLSSFCSSSLLHNLHHMVTHAKNHIHKPIQKLSLTSVQATLEILEPTFTTRSLKFPAWC